MVGSGQNVLIELWNGDELLHAGVLPPGQDFYGIFAGGRLPVDSFVLVRLTNAEVDALTPETRFGPVRLPLETARG